MALSVMLFDRRLVALNSVPQEDEEEEEEEERCALALRGRSHLGDSHCQLSFPHLPPSLLFLPRHRRSLPSASTHTHTHTHTPTHTHTHCMCKYLFHYG
ncbi:hypothetical protein LOAG_05041 [Loa loa]|uniref:Uncharacterized protein n=1 Tax=Loa loa TaxID=7209 RepID=A0A1S0U125_LOALO|nr:hypothetical protein LOAG_05041 [Loa loa]EFO23438.1 hypothetical protein LOAG_05041 [Loa loa]